MIEKKPVDPKKKLAKLSNDLETCKNRCEELDILVSFYNREIDRAEKKVKKALRLIRFPFIFLAKKIELNNQVKSIEEQIGLLEKKLESYGIEREKMDLKIESISSEIFKLTDPLKISSEILQSDQG